MLQRSMLQRSMLQPDFKQFSRLAREATLVPVVKSVSADLLTPVSAFLAIANQEKHAFLLEAVHARKGEGWEGRASAREPT
jgi:anthranilate synthase component I